MTKRVSFFLTYFQGRKKGILIQITEKIDHAVDYWKLNKYLNIKA